MPIFGTPSSHAPISAAQTSPARVSSAPSLPTSEPATARHGPPDSRLRSKPDTDYGAWSSSCDTPRAYPPIWVPLPVVGHGHRAARRNGYVWLRRDPFVIGEQRMLCGYMYARAASWEPCLPGRSGHGTDSATSRWHVPLRRP